MEQPCVRCGPRWSSKCAAESDPNAIITKERMLKKLDKTCDFFLFVRG